MKHCVYLLTNTVTGKVYVGKANDLETRWDKHLRNAASGHATALYRAIRKHGKDAFTREVLEYVGVEDIAFEREVFWIAKLGSFGRHGYNMTAGGEGLVGWKHTEESKVLMARHGPDNGMYGRTHSDEARAKIVAAHTGNQYWLGKKHTPEAKAKISAATAGNKRCIGRKYSDATIQKMSESHQGLPAHNKGKPGKPWTDEQKQAQGNRVRDQWASGVRSGQAKSEEWKANHSRKIKESWARRKAQQADAGE